MTALGRSSLLARPRAPTLFPIAAQPTIKRPPNCVLCSADDVQTQSAANDRQNTVKLRGELKSCSRRRSLDKAGLLA